MTRGAFEIKSLAQTCELEITAPNAAGGSSDALEVICVLGHRRQLQGGAHTAPRASEAPCRRWPRRGPS